VTTFSYFKKPDKEVISWGFRTGMQRFIVGFLLPDNSKESRPFIFKVNMSMTVSGLLTRILQQRCGHPNLVKKHFLFNTCKWIMLSA